ncbi:L-asparaginase, type II [Denitrovibrio acetiphilus DSM 12809]|uniref:L-asparaginase, type II n=1 Tax=Denitrovibrio acetiphilus (strain DSM 12809 / NBRC 114555 / N2460) TaxID=522772 RepID=D4H157_DENA2|nr:type II asparaginase [Denitrovibrio acetiphilus]ADD68720.1 L-asparaginase, type II [Denitrovibrio acetiphilus DSM 12809]
MRRNCLMKLLSLVILLCFTAANAYSADLPKVVILATGGTIAGSAASQTNTTGYKAGTIGVETLINAVPEIKELAEVSGEQVCNTASPNMTNEILLQLGKRVNELLSSKDVDGVVITHGTDTLEETAYFLNLVVKSDKPVVVVGAMRPATAISADGPMNLYNAVLLASSKEAKGRGAYILMNDRIGSARFVSKTNTTMTDTFKSHEQGYLGAIAGGKIYFWNQITKKHTFNSEFDISKIKELPRVDIIYSHQSDDGVFYDAAVKAGAKGIVSAGSGNGSLSDATKLAGKDAQKAGVVFVQSSRVNNGIITPKKSGRVGLYANSLNPAKSRILLMVALTKTSDPEVIQRYFDEY